MRKIMFLCLSILLVSCSQNEEWQDMDANETTLENLSGDYELALKGYTLEELSKEKDETTPTTQEETRAEPELMKALQNPLNKADLYSYSKTRTDARAYGGATDLVGVFKYAGCGNYREFVYNMDCEDGGWTRSEGNIGATTIDGSKNVTFRFCLVPFGNYGGGVLFLTKSIGATEAPSDIVIRNHDNEDHNNGNRILDNGGLSTITPSRFDKNTTFYWGFSESNTSKLNFTYGVITNKVDIMGQEVSGTLFIDDENGKNANHAVVASHGISRVLNDGELFRGIRVDHNTNYYLKFK